MNTVALGITVAPQAGGPARGGSVPNSNPGTAIAASVPPPPDSPAPQPPSAPADVPANLQPGQQALDAAVSRIREFIKSSSATLDFSVDHSTEQVVLRVTDTQTGALIRQVPSDEVLAIARALDRIQGTLVSQKA